MYKLTITTRDYAPFTVTGNEPDLLTYAMIVSSDLQMRQAISVEVSSASGSARIEELRSAGCLLQAVTDCIAFCTPKGGAA